MKRKYERLHLKVKPATLTRCAWQGKEGGTVQAESILDSKWEKQ